MTEARETRRAPREVFAREYMVFNADQVTGYSPPATPAQSAIERIEHAESARGAN